MRAQSPAGRTGEVRRGAGALGTRARGVLAQWCVYCSDHVCYFFGARPLSIGAARPGPSAVARRRGKRTPVPRRTRRWRAGQCAGAPTVSLSGISRRQGQASLPEPCGPLFTTRATPLRSAPASGDGGAETCPFCYELPTMGSLRLYAGVAGGFQGNTGRSTTTDGRSPSGRPTL